MTRRRSDVPETRASGDPVQLQTRRREWRSFSADGMGERIRCKVCGTPMGMVQEVDTFDIVCGGCQMGPEYDLKSMGMM